MSAPLVLAIVLAVAIPVQLFRAYRSDESLVERWAGDHGLALTPESRPLVAGYLRTRACCGPGARSRARCCRR